jgi:prephenate dehydrogenase
MPADEHDRTLALISHLPHAVASVLATMVPETLFRLAGSGFLDTTRIAAGEPELWLQIFSQNRDNVLSALETYQSKLKAFDSALRQGDDSQLAKILTTAKTNRDAMGS